MSIKVSVRRDAINVECNSAEAAALLLDKAIAVSASLASAEQASRKAELVQGATFLEMMYVTLGKFAQLFWRREDDQQARRDAQEAKRQKMA